MATAGKGLRGASHTTCKAQQGQWRCDNQSPRMSCRWTKYSWKSWYTQGLRGNSLGLAAGRPGYTLAQQGFTRWTLHRMSAVGRSRNWVGVSAARKGGGGVAEQVDYVLCSNILWKSFKECCGFILTQASYPIVLERLLLTPSHIDWPWWTGTDSRPAACQSTERRRFQTQLQQWSPCLSPWNWSPDHNSPAKRKTQSGRCSPKARLGYVHLQHSPIHLVWQLQGQLTVGIHWQSFQTKEK